MAKEIKQKAKNLLSKFDIFGNTFSFNINHNEKIGSVLGGIFTLITMLLTLTLAIYNIILFSESRDPQMTIAYDYRNQSLPMNISKEDISVGIGLHIIEENADPI